MNESRHGAFARLGYRVDSVPWGERRLVSLRCADRSDRLVIRVGPDVVWVTGREAYDEPFEVAFTRAELSSIGRVLRVWDARREQFVTSAGPRVERPREISPASYLDHVALARRRAESGHRAVRVDAVTEHTVMPRECVEWTVTLGTTGCAGEVVRIAESDVRLFVTRDLVLVGPFATREAVHSLARMVTRDEAFWWVRGDAPPLIVLDEEGAAVMERAARSDPTNLGEQRSFTD